MALSVRISCCLLLSFVCFIGCSDVKKLDLSEAKLSGTITYKGKPVPHALVIVSTASGEGLAGQGFADKDGNFSVEHVPAGKVKIGINTDAGRGNMMSAVMSSSVGKDKSAAPTFVDVPKKYFDPNTSGIETQITDPKGTTKFDVKID